MGAGLGLGIDSERTGTTTTVAGAGRRATQPMAGIARRTAIKSLRIILKENDNTVLGSTSIGVKGPQSAMRYVLSMETTSMRTGTMPARIICS